MWQLDKKVKSFSFQKADAKPKHGRKLTTAYKKGDNTKNTKNKNKKALKIVLKNNT